MKWMDNAAHRVRVIKEPHQFQVWAASLWVVGRGGPKDQWKNTSYWHCCGVLPQGKTLWLETLCLQDTEKSKCNCAGSFIPLRLDVFQCQKERCKAGGSVQCQRPYSTMIVDCQPTRQKVCLLVQRSRDSFAPAFWLDLKIGPQKSVHACYCRFHQKPWVGWTWALGENLFCYFFFRWAWCQNVF